MSADPSTPDLYQVTLASIGDAVIATDTDGTVTFMNHVAERLTGWPSAEAKGRPLTEVFRIVNEHTRQPAPNPADRALREGHIVGLANHTVLIARDGKEVPIDDSAAPIKDAAGTISGAVLVFRDITERRRADRERAILAAIVESSDDAIVSKTLDGVIVSWNAGAERVFGYTAAEAVGKSITMIIPPERLGEETDILARLRRGERIDHFETVRVAKDGRLLDISLTVSPVRDRDGRIVGASKVARDVTARRRAEAALRAAEERFDFVRRSSGVGFWYCDLPFDVLEWDERVKAHFHLPPDARVTIDTFYERIHPDDRGPTRAAIERSIAGREPYDVHYRTVDPDGGAVKWVRAIGRTGYAADGTPARFDGITLDVTEQRRAEEELQDQHRILETLYATGTRLAAELDLGKLLQALTDETTALTGAAFGAFFYNAVDARGNSYLLYTLSGAPMAAFEKFPHPRATAVFEPTFRGLGAVRLDDVTRDPRFGRNPPYNGMPDGHLPVRSYLAVPVTSRSGEVYGGLFFGHPDAGVFTERHEKVVAGVAAQAAVALDNARLYERLKESDRRKDEFLATLAHELRNPLAPIRTGVQVLKSSPAPAETAETLAMMERQAGHLAHLVDDLMDVARVTSGKIKLRKARVDLRAVVANALEASRPAVEVGGHALEVRTPGTALPVDGDPTRLVQILTNLLTNAAKYTEPGGRIEVAAVQEGDEAVVRVTDTGIGIPGDMLPKVFDMFAQVGTSLERSQGGLGIGLTLVRTLVAMHGGTVGVASAGSDQGSTFTVRLPLATGEAAPEVLAAPGSVGQSPRPLKVLVVDDSRDGATSLALLLKLTGHAARTAHTGPEGLQLAAEFRPDVIFLDIGLPGMSGHEVAKALRRDPAFDGTTIVALTGWGSEEDRRKSREAGCDEHLTKPVDADEVRRVLAGRGRRDG